MYRTSKEKTDRLAEDKKNLGIKFSELISPSHLIKKDGITDAKNLIESYREYIGRHRAFLNEFNSEKLKKLKDSNIKNPSFWDSYNKSQKNSNQVWAMFFETENRYLDVTSLMINLIETNIDRITVENDIFIFESTDELTQYNKYSSELEKISAKEQAIISKLQSFEDPFKKWFGRIAKKLI